VNLPERADACLAALDDAGRAIARRVVLRLIRFGDGPSAHRTQPVSALRAGEEPERLAQILRHLAAGELVALDGDAASDDANVALADPALVTAWPALRAWIKAHRQAEPLRRQLETDAADWSQRTARGDRDVELLDKAQLGELGAWLTDDTRRDLGVSATAESFLAASRAAARKQWWPGKTTMSTALVLLMMLLILATPIILLLIVVLTASVIHKFL